VVIVLVVLVHSIRRSTGLGGRVIALVAVGLGTLLGYVVVAVVFMSFMMTHAH